MTRRLLLLLGLGLVALIAPPAAGAAVLHDQTDAASATGEPGPNFSPSNDFGGPTSDRTADDFVVPAGQKWTIQQIDVLGAYGLGGSGAQVNAFIYSDAAGKPGTELLAKPAITATGGPNFSVPVSGAPVLGPGTYWVTIQYVTAAGGFWSWGTRAKQSGNPAQHNSPGGPPECLTATWVPRATCWPGANPDQAFKLQGTRVVKKKCKKKAKKKSGASAATPQAVQAKKKCKKKKKK